MIGKNIISFVLFVLVFSVYPMDKTYGLMPGNEGQAYVSGVKNVFVTTDEKAIQILDNALISKDLMETLLELTLQGRILALTNGTRIKALRYVDGGMEIRITSGEYKGRRAFILHEWIQK